MSGKSFRRRGGRKSVKGRRLSAKRRRTSAKRRRTSAKRGGDLKPLDDQKVNQLWEKKWRKPNENSTKAQMKAHYENNPKALLKDYMNVMLGVGGGGRRHATRRATRRRR